MRKQKETPESEPVKPSPNRFGELISGFRVAPSVFEAWNKFIESGGRKSVQAVYLEEAVMDLLTKNGKWGPSEIAKYEEEQRNRSKRGPAKGKRK